MSVPTETIITNKKSKVQSPKSEEEILSENGFYWRESEGVKVLVCRPLEERGFANGFSTRIGGVSDFPKDSLNLSGFDIDSRKNINENRRRFLKVFDGNYKIATVWQIHGKNIKIIRDKSDIESTEEKFDALICGLKKVLVGVKTADCVPVLVGDERTKFFAAIHAGWRGTAQEIVSKTIEKMRREFGVNAADLTAAIGAAAICDYEIGQEVIDAFRGNFPENYEHLLTPTRDGHANIDLHLANREQLLSAGVLPENIFTAPLCTMTRNDLFFSYRKDRKLDEKTGRLLSVIGRNSA